MVSTIHIVQDTEIGYVTLEPFFFFKTYFGEQTTRITEPGQDVLCCLGRESLCTALLTRSWSFSPNTGLSS